ncbi:hypothetical protein BP5796_12094 [Coleophoma crateriformis]|uniref:Heterokaryon incompatibility domain-containing protein n=1 Tax=Coleophoma crateriformis TaxID=565419 RepID=A0A3D8QBZ8_9HELO|nr:hypothetical protein BP5796_12094 [Coleophoma crateriformis]
MDHVPQFVSPDHVLPKVTYRGVSEPYDGKGFWKYPERRGWSLEGLELGLRMGSAQALLETPPQRRMNGNSIQDPKDFAQLLQSWWYFGMLHEVLGESFQLEDFIQDSATPGEQIVTTAKLERQLQAWWGRMNCISRSDAMLKLLEAMKCMNWVRQLLEVVSSRIEKFRESPEHQFRVKVSMHHDPVTGLNLGPFKDLETPFWRRNGRKLLPEHLELSICILGHTLSHAARSIYSKLALGDLDEFRQLVWYCPNFVYRRMAKQNFCPMELERFKSSLQIMGGYLASTLRCRSESVNHSNCSTIRCEADNIIKETYKQAHACVEGNCHSGPSMKGLEFQKVLDILDNGQVPVVRVFPDKSAGDFGLFIEVIPADTCSCYVAISHVWADGLGNVSDNSLYTCQWLRLQNLAQQSFLAARNGIAVSGNELVFLWIDTFCVPCGKHLRRFRDSAIERMADTYRKAHTVLVIESQLALITDEMSDLEISMRISFCSWTRRLWTMHEGAVGAQVQFATKTRIMNMVDIAEAISAVVLEDQSNKSDSLIKGVGGVESMQLWARNLQRRGETGSHLFLFAWNECRRRSTSVEIDRYLVVGIILRLDEGTLSLLSRRPTKDEPTTEKNKQLRQEERVKIILNAVDQIPAGIIYTEGDRISEVGWGWAPNSMDLPIPYSNSPVGKRDKSGLYVSFPGVHLLAHPDWTRKFHISGTFTELDTSEQQLPTSRCAFCVKIGNEEPSEDIYTANIASASWNSDSVESNSRLAIVIHPEFKESRLWQRAILVKCSETLGDVIHCKFICQMHWIAPQTQTIALLKDGLENGLYEAVTGTWCANGYRQKWCIG